VLLVHPEKQQSEKQEDDHPDPQVAALFSVIGGLGVEMRVRIRQRLVHLLLLCPVGNVQFDSNIFSHSKSRAGLQAVALGSLHLIASKALTRVLNAPVQSSRGGWRAKGDNSTLRADARSQMDEEGRQIVATIGLQARESLSLLKMSL
jgi:hypothetical protein